MAHAAPPELEALGLRPSSVQRNRPAPVLVEQALARHEGQLTSTGALAALTGSHTGRSPQDKYIVREPGTESLIGWGKVNRPLDEASFDKLLARVQSHFTGRDLFIHDALACADPTHRLNVRIVAEQAWQALFAHCLFLRLPDTELPDYRPDWTILAAGRCQADPVADGVRSPTFIVLHPGRKLVLIGGTEYAGEIKKSVFTILNLLLPGRGVFPMHCSANIGRGGDTALFFGLSGTGKTTLSADPDRRLIGDDEHAWADDGVFNIEGGCYAKTIKLKPETEPQIFDAIRFPCVLENVVVRDDRTPNYDSAGFTENTRAAYPLDHIAGCEPSGRGGHPKNLFFLTCDAFGVLPPISRLTPEQAMYHFLSGYTAKVAGTERGVTEPQVTFSTCFGQPFLPLPPIRYAELLRQKMKEHQANVWLVNTGWTGGPTGVGQRMPLKHTRALLKAALTGELANATFVADPIFGVSVPQSVPGVPGELLQPRGTWSDPAAYDAKANDLARQFVENFCQHAAQAGDDVRNAGPK